MTASPEQITCKCLQCPRRPQGLQPDEPCCVALEAERLTSKRSREEADKLLLWRRDMLARIFNEGPEPTHVGIQVKP